MIVEQKDELIFIDKHTQINHIPEIPLSSLRKVNRLVSDMRLLPAL